MSPTLPEWPSSFPLPLLLNLFAPTFSPLLPKLSSTLSLYSFGLSALVCATLAQLKLWPNSNRSHLTAETEADNWLAWSCAPAGPKAGSLLAVCGLAHTAHSVWEWIACRCCTTSASGKPADLCVWPAASCWWKKGARLVGGRRARSVRSGPVGRRRRTRSWRTSKSSAAAQSRLLLRVRRAAKCLPAAPVSAGGPSLRPPGHNWAQLAAIVPPCQLGPAGEDE